jgi:iron(III) transport system permease protein
MRWFGYIALWLFLVATIILPVGLVLAGGLSPMWLAEVLRQPLYREGLLTAFLVATVVTTGCFLVTVPLAWLAWRFRFAGRGLAEAMLLTPLILPPFVGALGVFQLFGHYGIVNLLGAHLGLWTQGPDWLGDHRLALVCLIEILGLYPVLYLTLAASFSRLDPALIEAAQVAGANRLTVLRRVVLPLLKPGLFAGGAVVFVWSFTELGTPLMLGYDRITSVQIYNGLADIQTNRLPLALVVVMLVVVAGLYAGGRALAGRSHEALVAKGGGGGDGSRNLSGWQAVLVWLPFAALAFAAAAPHLVVVLLSVASDWYRTLLPAGVTLDRYREALAHPQVVPAISNSLGYSAAATCIAVALGLAVAWISVRWKPRGAALLDGLAMIPLAVPGLIMAFGFLGVALLVTVQFPALKPFIDPQSNPAPLLILAYAVRRLPHVVRAVTAGLSQAPVVLEEAAAACGAGPWTRLRRITLPLIAGSLAAGALLTFSFSMLEVSDSLILAQQRDAWPVTKVIYELAVQLGQGPALACAFGVWAMLFLTSCLAAAAVFLGKGPTSLFRS